MARNSKIDPETEIDRRRSQRFRIENMQHMTLLAGARSYDCAIQDISRGGVRLALNEPAPLASEVVLEHPAAGHFRGRRMWSDGHQIGVTFENMGSDLAQALRCVQMVVAGNPTLEAS